MKKGSSSEHNQFIKKNVKATKIKINTTCSNSTRNIICKEALNYPENNDDMFKCFIELNKNLMKKGLK